MMDDRKRAQAEKIGELIYQQHYAAPDRGDGVHVPRVNPEAINVAIPKDMSPDAREALEAYIQKLRREQEESEASQKANDYFKGNGQKVK